jgi:hypothetical protein
MYVHMFMYKSTKMYHPGRESDVGENKQADRFVIICVHIVRIWLVSLRTTCRLGFCLLYTFNGSNPAPPQHTANSVSPEVGSHLGWHNTVCWPLRDGRGTQYTQI